MANEANYIGVAMGLDVTDLKAGLSEANKQIQLANSEFKAASSGMDDWTKSTEGLSAKVKQLDSVLKAQKSKLAGLTAEYDKVVKEQGEGSDAAKKLKVQINNQQAVVNKTEKEYKNFSETLDKAEQGIIDLEKVAIRGGKAVAQMGDDAKTSGSKLSALKSAGKVVGAGVAAVGTAAVAAAGALAGAATNAAAYADDMLTMSTVTGVSTDDLQAFSYAAGLVDVEVETLTKSMAKNVKSMSSAQQGSKAYADAYAQLGVSVTDANGNLRDGETVYWEAIDALGKMENETERDALAMQLFGKSAQELNPLIEAGSEKMNALKQEAKDVGAVMSEEALNSLGSFDDSIQRLSGSAGAAKNALGTVLLPEMQGITDAGGEILGEFAKNLNASGGGISGLASAIKSVAPMVSEAIGSLVKGILETVNELIPSIASIIVELVPTLANTILDAVPQLVTVIIDLVTQLINLLGELLPQIAIKLTEILPQVINALIAAIPQLLQAAIQFFMAIVQAIPTIIQNLISALPSIIETIIDAVMQAIPMLLDAAIQLLMAIVDAIPVLIQTLVDNLPKIITTIINGILKALPQLLQAAVTLFLEIVKAIPKIIPPLISALPTIINAVVSALMDNLPTMLKAAVTLFMEIVKAIPKIVIELVKATPDIIKAVVKGLADGVKSMAKAGLNLVKGIWQGIKDGAKWLKEKITGFASDVAGWFKKTFKIKSPSRLMADEVGKYLGEGIGVGVVDSIPAVKKQLGKFAGFVQDNLGGIKSGLSIDAVGASSLAKAKAGNTVVNAGMTVNYNGKLSRKEIKRLENDNYQAVFIKLKKAGAI